MKELLTYKVIPEKGREQWSVAREGKKAKVSGLPKKKAIQKALGLLAKGHKPALLLIHKTRYIIEQQVLIPK